MARRVVVRLLLLFVTTLSLKVGLAAQLPEALTPATIAEAAGKQLDEVVLPFWTDPERLTEGPLWPESEGVPLIRQLRLLYVHAIAIRREDDRATRERLRDQYDALFLETVARYRTAEGVWLASVSFDGSRAVIEDRQTVCQAYVVYVMAECARLLSDGGAREVAIEAFRLLDERAHDAEHGGYVERMDRPLDAPENRTRQLGTLMHVGLGLARLHRMAPTALTRERLSELRDLIIEHTPLPSGNAPLGFDRSWKPARVGDDPGQQTLYGHNAELAWYMLEVFEALGDDPHDHLPWLRRVAVGVIRNGIGPDGRVYTWGPWRGAPRDRDNVRWWPHTEAVLMLARLAQLTGDTAYQEPLERVLRFTFEHFAPDEPGPWLSDVNPATGATADGRAESWKAGLHTSRMLVELERIMRKPAAVPGLSRERRPLGRTVQLEPGFAYWQNRSAESIVSEVKGNGFEAILLICTTDRITPPDLVEAAHQAGLKVWGTFFPSGVYMPDELFPPQRDQWRMQFEGNGFSAYRFFSYVHPDYAEWWKGHLARMQEAYGFDGVLWYEVHYPTIHGPTAWGGPSTFGDVSPGFAEAFRRQTGRRDFPDFSAPESPTYYEKDTALYRDYIEFRVNSIVDFHREVLDGEGGFRRRFPEVPFATWTIALARPGALEALRDNEAQDPARIVAEVRPDLHFLQSHYPDWGPRDQTPEYVRGYAPYVEAVRAVDPDLPIGIQGDIASTCDFRRTPEWMEAWERECQALGAETTTYYEFALRWEVHHAAPQAVEGGLAADGSGVVAFDQRIDPASCQALVGREVEAGCTVTEATADGNLLRFRLTGPLPAGQVKLPIGGLSDWPEVRFPFPTKGVGEPNVVPEGETVVLRPAQ